jgi:hypothetical protein
MQNAKYYKIFLEFFQHGLSVENYKSDTASLDR